MLHNMYTNKHETNQVIKIKESTPESKTTTATLPKTLQTLSVKQARRAYLV